jgi:Raf kinase inhibitor-like YbhB/YbcL family protein
MGRLARSFTALAAAAFIGAAPLVARAEPFTVSSPAFGDDQLMPVRFAFDKPAPDGHPCGGRNVSPPLTWTGAPPGTKSYAVTLIDPDGHKGLGFAHLVAYNVPASVTSIPEGEPAAGGTPGKIAEFSGYRGICPPLGDAPHHYIFQVYALDVELNLAPGLDRDALLKAIAPHILGVTSYAGRFARSQ